MARVIMLLTVSASFRSGWIPIVVERYVIARKIVAKIVPMRTRVLIAFVSSGRRKLGTPLATASLPVKPTEPDANARRTRRSVSGVVPSGGNGFGGATGAGGSPVTIRNSPKATNPYIAIMYAYVGAAKRSPAS